MKDLLYHLISNAVTKSKRKVTKKLVKSWIFVFFSLKKISRKKEKCLDTLSYYPTKSHIR